MRFRGSLVPQAGVKPAPSEWKLKALTLNCQGIPGLWFLILIFFAQELPWCSAGKEPTCNAGDPGLIPGSGRSTGEGRRLPTPVFLGFPGGSAGKESACSAGDLGSVPGLGRSPGEGKGYPLQYSGLENSLDFVVHGVAESQTWLSDFHFHFFLAQHCTFVEYNWYLLLGSYLNCLYWSILQDAFKGRISWLIFLCSMKGDIYGIHITYTLCLADYFLNLW